MTCHNCNSLCKRFGKHRNGLQRFRCKQCGRTLTEERDKPLDDMNFSRQDLELFIQRRYIDTSTRTELEKIIDLKSRMVAAEAHLEAIDKEVTEIGEDQQRLRDNIKALTATAEAKQLISRYVSKADTQETRLEQLNKDKQTVNEERVRLQLELESLIRNLSINRQLASAETKTDPVR